MTAIAIDADGTEREITRAELAELFTPHPEGDHPMSDRTVTNGTAPTTTIAEVREVCATVGDRLTTAAWGAPLPLRAELMAEAGRLKAACHALEAIASAPPAPAEGKPKAPRKPRGERAAAPAGSEETPPAAPRGDGKGSPAQGSLIEAEGYTP